MSKINAASDFDFVREIVGSDGHDTREHREVVGEADGHMTHGATEVDLDTGMQQKALTTGVRHHHHIHSEGALIPTPKKRA